MFGFRRTRPDLSASARQLGAAGAKVRMDRARALRRDMVDRLRADMRAKGIDAPPIDWDALS